MAERSDRSAGLLIHRGGASEVLLVLPGGPFWRNKYEGAWQIPKGFIEEGEDELEAALREVGEELGSNFVNRAADAIPLGELVQAGGKEVTAFALEADFDPESLVSNTFEMEWPPKSGRMAKFPEIDRACWFTLDEARPLMLPSQLPFLDRFRAGDVS